MKQKMKSLIVLFLSSTISTTLYANTLESNTNANLNTQGAQNTQTNIT